MARAGSPSTAGSPELFFHEQSGKDTCLAACVTMVQARRRDLEPAMMAARERELAATVSIWVELAAQVLGTPPMHAPDSTLSFIHLEAELAAGCWIIVIVRPRPLQSFYTNSRPPPGSRHGTLIGDGLDHACVLIGAEDATYAILDPWLYARHQPVRISREAFAAVWTGVFISVPIGA